MRITNKQKLFGAVAVAGIVAASGSAFTGTGLTRSAPATQYVGGTVSQSVTGAILSSVSYHFTDATNTAVDSVTLSLSGNVEGKVPTIVLAGGTAFTCSAVDTGSSTCTPDDENAVGVTGIAVTI